MIYTRAFQSTSAQSEHLFKKTFFLFGHEHSLCVFTGYPFDDDDDDDDAFDYCQTNRTTL